ncbi:MAG: hypothetical protein AAF747_03190 [Planctomycetota bacterium]
MLAAAGAAMAQPFSFAPFDADVPDSPTLSLNLGNTAPSRLFTGWTLTTDWSGNSGAPFSTEARVQLFDGVMPLSPIVAADNGGGSADVMGLTFSGTFGSPASYNPFTNVTAPSQFGVDALRPRLSR